MAWRDDPASTILQVGVAFDEVPALSVDIERREFPEPLVIHWPAPVH